MNLRVELSPDDVWLLRNGSVLSYAGIRVVAEAYQHDHDLAGEPHVLALDPGDLRLLDGGQLVGRLALNDNTRVDVAGARS